MAQTGLELLAEDDLEFFILHFSIIQVLGLQSYAGQKSC